MENLIIELAKSEDIKVILDILEKRCIWMEMNNIEQWRRNSYTLSYNDDYFTKEIEKNRVFVAKINMKVRGVFLLRENDSLWDESGISFYIHHFATDINYKGLGRIIIEYIKYIALKHNKSYIRLDCVKNNEKLNNYYEEMGFVLKKHGKIRNYEYNLRELRLKE